jgi:hypothetical protein
LVRPSDTEVRSLLAGDSHLTFSQDLMEPHRLKSVPLVALRAMSSREVNYASLSDEEILGI